MSINTNHIDIIRQELFNRLKEENYSPESLYQLAKDYEELLNCIRCSVMKNKEEIIVSIGRALSNIIERLRKINFFSDFLTNENVGHLEKSKLVFLAHRGGFCNRARALASLEGIAHEIGLDFNYYWVETLSCEGLLGRNKNFISLSELIFMRLNSLEKNIFIIDDPNSAGFFYKKLEQNPK